MRFHGMMVVRDEADVLAQTLDDLLRWIDGVYILDTGSTDGTWNIVQDYARRDRRVKPLYSRPLVFKEGLRARVFDAVREQIDPGDWVLRVDGDEFYHIPPPQFVRERLHPLDSAVHLQWYFFRLTTDEVAAYGSGAVDVMQDRQRSITDRRRFYKVSTYAEPRMFRYRKSVRWPEAASFPYNAGFVSRERIPIRHYPHRDPLQMEQRFRLRSAIRKLAVGLGTHWYVKDWHTDLVDPHAPPGAAKATEGLAGESGIDTGPLLYWTPGTELPMVRLTNHVPPLRTRLMQRAVHPLLLPILDRRRPAFDSSSEPEPLPTNLSIAS